MSDFCCRICGGKIYHTLFQWNIPLAADVRDQAEDGIKYPVEPLICMECGHVQLKESIEYKYNDYLYTPFYSDEFKEYIAAFTDCLNRRLAKGKRVIEVGSSNGYLLGQMKSKGWDVLGFEPSLPLAAAAEEKGVHTEQMYFGSEESLNYIKNWGTPDVIIIRHVMEHLDNLNVIVQMVSDILDNGIFVMEVPWLLRIVEEKQFYAFFHEHLSYFTVTAIQNLLDNHGLSIIDIEENNLEGGSIVVYAGKSNIWEKSKEKISAYLEREKACCSVEKMKEFAEEISGQINKIKQLVKEKRTSGKRLAAWGAGQRGVSLINICGLTSREIDFIVDVNENYWWKYILGESNIQIVSPDFLRNHFVDYIMIFATGYADEIISANSEYLNHGGEFIKIIDYCTC